MRNLGALGGDAAARTVTDAVAEAVAALRPAVDRDWSAVRAGRVEWDCLRTAEHVVSDLFAYATQLVTRAPDAYRPVEYVLNPPDAGAGSALEAIEAGGAMLALACRTVPRSARGFHPAPFLSAGREGFAAMGVAEVLLHTHDIAEGLGIAYRPSEEPCGYVLARIFPHLAPGEDPWRTLLRATGREAPPGEEPVTVWRWYNDPLIEAERLTLEGLTVPAAADLALGGDGGLDWVDGGPFDGTREGAGLVVAAYGKGAFRPEWGSYALVRREDDRAVGSMGFHGPPDAEGRVEIGYDLATAARGHGYATEALRALAAWALAQESVGTVTARVDPGNTASRRVLERAGFLRTGHLEEDGGVLVFERRGD
ncbi:GNAT family N-acetyltransferase [Streptomyces sp. MJP52]|uniref:GNAT family N-acetyltransferase n=1 Tax=Streptomyces sp. MJP52 TaxID=2940555 RepID=UPI002473E115|nr:GNAT family N-acetyltransferase [Streptomyces sp. MJP52]MDH6226379.1 RimJ/RimL family protein N-acetyltransferase [Streptomyces sp. MJP52]